MAELPSAPAYPNYAGFLSDLIGNLPGDFRSAQLQQGQVDRQNTFKNGVPTNPDGTPNWAAALQMQAKNDPNSLQTLGPLSQQQAYNTQGQVPSPMLGGGGQSPVASPPAAAPAPTPSAVQAPAAAPIQPSPPSEAPPPSLAAMVSGAVPDPTKSAMMAGLIGRALKVDPAAPLTPDQAARAQRIIAANIPRGTAPLPQPSPFGTIASATPLQPDAEADMAARERAAGYDPNVKWTQAEAVATGNGAPSTGGTAGPFALPPAAEAVWGKMVSQESRGQQFNPDGSVVTSPKGAVGIAQVMPGTGPEAAKLAGLPWDPVKFKNDPNYNLALGKAYYAKQVQTFGSPEIAAAAYNAGAKATISAQAKANSRGGSWLSYLPAETQDYVAKVTSGGAAPQAGGGAQTATSAPQGGGKPIFPQPALPVDPTTGKQFPDAESAIRGYDQQIARYASIPNNAGMGTAQVLQQERDRLIASMQPMKIGSTDTYIDPRTGQTVAQGPFAAGGGMTPEALNNAAMTSIQTGQDPKNLGRGAQGAQNLIALQNRKAEIMAEHGWSPDDVAKMQQKFKAQQGVLKEFESGKDSRSVGSYNTLVSHLETLRTAIGALGNGDVRALNWFKQEWNRQTGNPAPTNFEGVKELVGDEIIKAVTGGAGALGDREGIKKTLEAVSSPQALNSMLDQYRELSVGQLKTFKRRYEFGTGRKDFDEMLAPETLKYFGEGGSPGQPGGGGGGTPTIVNPQTGQKMRLSDDGKSWVPMQ